MEIIWVILMGLVGVYCIAAAWCNWDWFFNNHRAQGFVSLFGRNGARIAYAVIGVLLLAGSIFVLVGEYF